MCGSGDRLPSADLTNREDEMTASAVIPGAIIPGSLLRSARE
jgi:hypothetical protein